MTHPSPSRRRFVLGVGAIAATAVGIGAGSNVLAAGDSSLPLRIDVHAKEEYVVVTNTSPATLDLGGDVIDFEYNGTNHQKKTFPDGTTIGSGDSLTVATGAKPVSDA